VTTLARAADGDRVEVDKQNQAEYLLLILVSFAFPPYLASTTSTLERVSRLFLEVDKDSLLDIQSASVAERG
jgi:hypothetical protein